MTHTVVIAEDEFERARIAFTAAWMQQDRLLERLTIKGAAGTRTRAGLTAALAELGIKVES
jgi:hypothetical protein